MTRNAKRNDDRWARETAIGNGCFRRLIRREWSICGAGLVALMLFAVSSFAHELFLVTPDHYLSEATATSVSVYNGAFAYSENAVRPRRFVDASIVDGAGTSTRQGDAQWRVDEKASVLDFQTGAAGTYVIGVSTKPRKVKMAGEKFAAYLADAGLFEALEKRRSDGDISDAARERYAKHAKTIIQVGDETTDAYTHRFGYPLEIIPLSNPAMLTIGDTLELLVLSDGEPLVDYPVYASYGGFSGDRKPSTEEDQPATDAGATVSVALRPEAFAGRTDQDGLVRVDLVAEGRWYVRLIELLEMSKWGLDYQSNWATLTFEIR